MALCTIRDLTTDEIIAKVTDDGIGLTASADYAAQHGGYVSEVDEGAAVPTEGEDRMPVTTPTDPETPAPAPSPNPTPADEPEDEGGDLTSDDANEPPEDDEGDEDPDAA
jgi:hypothetical protein